MLPTGFEFTSIIQANMVKPETAQKAEAQSEERTETGIYAGVEKYAKEDDPADNVARDPATGDLTGAGIPPTTAELSRKSEAHGKTTVGPDREDRKPGKAADSSVEVVDEVTRRAVVPAPAPTREHLIENYPTVYPELEKQAIVEAKRKEEAEKEAEKHLSSGSSDSDSSDDEATNENGVVTKADGKSKHRKPKIHHEKDTPLGPDGHHHRGPVKAVIHALHLDRHDRKIEQDEKKEEEKEMEERKRRIKVRNEMFKHSTMNELTQTEETFREEEETDPAGTKKSTAEGGAVSDARAPNEAIPLEILNPEGMVRKEKEDEVLKNGGDFGKLAWTEKEEIKVPKDRIDNLLQVERARKKAGLPVEERDKELKVAFHTADAFDKLDTVQT